MMCCNAMGRCIPEWAVMWPRHRGFFSPDLGFGRLEHVAFIGIHATCSNLLALHVREAQNRFPLLSNMF